MNDLIIELAKQAGAHWNHGDFNMGSSVEFQESDLGRFVQLVVKDCLTIMEECNCHSEDDMEFAISSIRKHFGVE